MHSQDQGGRKVSLPPVRLAAYCSTLHHDGHICRTSHHSKNKCYQVGPRRSGSELGGGCNGKQSRLLAVGEGEASQQRCALQGQQPRVPHIRLSYFQVLQLCQRRQRTQRHLRIAVQSPPHPKPRAGAPTRATLPVCTHCQRLSRVRFKVVLGKTARLLTFWGSRTSVKMEVDE